MNEPHPEEWLIGYARVLTYGQTLDSQLEQLRKAGCAIPQQAISIVSNVDDIESHIQRVELIRCMKYIEVFDLSVGEREHVMKELALMGITAGALFPSLDGAFESLKERNF